MAKLECRIVEALTNFEADPARPAFVMQSFYGIRHSDFVILIFINSQPSTNNF